MNASVAEIYKCSILTVIAALLGAVLWRMPPKPVTLGQLRASNKGSASQRVRQKQAELTAQIPLSYVWDGSVTVENEELPVEVENEVELEIQH